MPCARGNSHGQTLCSAVLSHTTYLFGIYGKYQGSFGKNRRWILCGSADLFRFLKQYRGLADEQQPESEIAIDDIDLPMLQSVTLNDLYEYLN